VTFANAWILHFLWLLSPLGLALVAYHRNGRAP